MTLVPSPTKFPNGCIKCRSTKGPIYDGGTVTAHEWELYVCRTCAEVIASEYGLTAGAEMDRLRDAAAELAQRDKEAERHAEEMAHFATQVSEYKREIILLNADLEAERGKVLTMEHAAQDVRTAVGTLAGVGADTNPHLSEKTATYVMQSAFDGRDIETNVPVDPED